MPIPLGVLAVAGAGAAKETFWVRGNFSSTSVSDGFGIAATTNQNSFVIAGTNTDYFIGYDSAGSNLFTKQFTTNVFGMYGLGKQSNNKVVGVGRFTSGSGPIQMTSSATIDWQTTVAYGAVSSMGKTDKSGNSYVVAVGGFAKFDNSGAIQYQRNFGSIAEFYCDDLDVDSSGNLYMVGQALFGGVFRRTLIKADSTGGISWARSFTNMTALTCVKINSNDEVIVAGRTEDSFNSAAVIKVNSSGTVEWARGNNAGSSAPRSINRGCLAIDSSNNIYIAARNTQFTEFTHIIRMSNDGTQTWGRSLYRNDGRIIQGQSLTLNESGNIHLLGISDYNGSAGVNSPLNFKFPGDGTLTGTYLGFVYESGGATLATTYTQAVASETVTSSASSRTVTTGVSATIADFTFSSTSFASIG